MKKRNTDINEDDFRRYLENQMSEAERNRFERELQKHPFEAEALQGYENSTVDLNNDLKEIKNRIAGRKRKNGYRYWAAAATVLLLITAGLIWYQIGNESPTPEIAALKTEKQEEKIASVKDSVSEKNEVAKTEPLQEETAAKAVTEKQSETEEPPAARPQKQETVAAAAPEPVLENTNKKRALQNNISESKKTALAIRDTKIISDNRANTQTALKTQLKLKNLVTAENGAVELTGEKEFPVDTNDIFPDSFQTISPRVRETVQEIQGVAVQDNVERRSDRYLSDIAAYPQGGMDNYKKYLGKKAILPANYPKNRENVKLLLLIDIRGNVTDIRHQNTADSALFERSKNIIRNGPPWNPKVVNGEKIQSEVKLTIEFTKNNN